jgi:cation diffusion facilitator family transporter
VLPPENKAKHPALQSQTNVGYIRKVTLIGLLVNLLLSGIKFTAGFVGHSQALIADAIHSLSDTTTDIAVIAGSHYWARPPDEDHPYGHQRLETLITVFIGIMLAAAGIGIGWKAVSSLHQQTSGSPGLLAVLAALASIVCKEIIYRWTAYAGKKVRSSALAANAWHHRTDAVSSVPVLIAVGGALIFPSWSFLDQVGAVVVSIFILHAAFKIIWPGLSELIDAGVPADTQQRIQEIASSNAGVQQVHAIRSRHVSSSIFVDLHIVVDGNMTVREGHRIADDVENKIAREVPDVLDVVVHVDPPEVALDLEKAPSNIQQKNNPQ